MEKKALSKEVKISLNTWSIRFVVFVVEKLLNVLSVMKRI
jgi:hypothetical protein